MKTQLIPGAALRDDDQQITQKITRGGVTTGEKVLRIGIRNKAGVIYRTIDAAGPTEFIDAIQALVGLEFSDELEHAREPKYGFDAIFSKG